jgi:uncharacterized protein with PQ loop repeat
MGMRLTKKELNELNKAVMFVAIVEPLTTLPQIIDVFTKPNVSAVSVLTWALYAGFEAIWVFYGLVIKNRPIIITNCLWILMDLLVVAGVLFRQG